MLNLEFTSSKISLLVGCFIFFLLLSYFCLVRPIQQERHQILVKSKRITQQIKSKIILPQPILQQIKQHVSSELLMSAIAHMGEQCHLTSLEIKPKKRKNKTKLMMDQFNISARGSFFQLMQFYQQIFSSRWLMIIPNWEWEKSDSNDIELKAVLEVYHY